MRRIAMCNLRQHLLLVYVFSLLLYGGKTASGGILDSGIGFGLRDLQIPCSYLCYFVCVFTVRDGRYAPCHALGLLVLHLFPLLLGAANRKAFGFPFFFFPLMYFWAPVTNLGPKYNLI